MHGTIFDIKRFAVNDGPGIRTTIFFKGCLLKCQWCHNPEGISPDIESLEKTFWLNRKRVNSTEEIGRQISVDALWAEIKKDQIFMEESDGGVTFSGGEPLCQHLFLNSIIERCHSKNIHTCVDTSGGVNSSIIRQMKNPDLFLFDIKHINTKKHKQLTGAHNHTIIQNLKLVMNKKIPIRIRIPIIPKFNHSLEDIEQIATFLSQYSTQIEQIDLLPFHSLANHKYQQLGKTNSFLESQSVSPDELQQYLPTFQQKGFTTCIGG